MFQEMNQTNSSPRYAFRNLTFSMFTKSNHTGRRKSVFSTQRFQEFEMIKTVLFAFLFAGLELGAQTNSSSYSAGSKEDVSRLAGQMLDATNQARTAVEKHDRQLALQDVDRAERDLRQIEGRAHGATMVPVYQEFVSVSILGPVRAEQNARKAAANHTMAKVSTNNIAVHEVAGDYTEVMVSTAVARNGLAAAKAGLEKNNW